MVVILDIVFRYGSLLIASLGIALILTVVLTIIYKRIESNKERFMAKLDFSGVVTARKDAVTKWAAETERKMRSINLKIKVKRFIFYKVFSVAITFTWSLYYFKNLTATFISSLAMFYIPDYILHLFESTNNRKIANQLVLAIRIFVAEYRQHYQLEKAFAAIYRRVPKPLGNYFGDAYYDLLVRKPVANVLSSLSAKIDNYYGKMFISLLYQIQNDSAVLSLLTDILVKLEESIATGRENISTLAGERVLSLIIALSPIPIFLVMRKYVPEVEYFVINTMIGRMLISTAFLSMFLYIIIDKSLGKVG